jgi:hypothetical protein
MSNNIVECPHCKELIIIEELNCKIFRHGVFKETNLQINPHATKSECDYLIDNNLIYGCGKPFEIYLINNNYHIKICDYI